MYSGFGESADLKVALDEALDALKERLWKECWKEEIVLDGVVFEVAERGGRYYVRASFNF